MKRLLLVLAGLLAALPAFSQYYEKAETAFYEARYADAIRTALEGLSAEPARSSEESAVELCSILGASFARLGAFDKAAEYFVRCYRYDKEFGEPEGLSSSLINLASLYVYAGKPELGRSYALEAIGTEKPLNRPAKLAMAYGKACDVYHALEKPDSALYYANLAVASALESGDSLGVAIRRSQRAYPLLTLSRYGEAAEDLEYAEKVFREKNRRQSLSIVCFQQAGMYGKIGRETLAGRYYQEALALAREVEDKPFEQKVCHAYAEFLGSTRPDEAYELMAQSARLQEEIAQSESERALELYNIEFETARREKTIAAQRSRLILLAVILAALLVAAAVTAVSAIRMRRSQRQKDFLYRVISHDMLSPAIAQLRGIQMLRAAPDGSRSHEVLVQLERQAEGEVELIRNALRWAQLQEGGKPAEAACFSLATLAREAMEQHGVSAQQKGITLSLDAPDDAIVCCNRGTLLLVLRNLLSNAVKFSQPGSEVILRLARKDGKAALSVCDSGIGIPAEKLGSIFGAENVFRRQGTAGEPSHGIGLAVSYILTQKLGGSLSALSEEGKGSTFTIEMPLENE